MAKLQEEIVVIKVSKLIRDTDTSENNATVDKEFLTNLQEVVEQLAGTNALVEIQLA